MCREYSRASDNIDVHTKLLTVFDLCNMPHMHGNMTIPTLLNGNRLIRLNDTLERSCLKCQRTTCSSTALIFNEIGKNRGQKTLQSIETVRWGRKSQKLLYIYKDLFRLDLSPSRLALCLVSITVLLSMQLAIICLENEWQIYYFFENYIFQYMEKCIYCARLLHSLRYLRNLLAV